ncbi:hypothetical protein V499_00853 [Pseudogymnoascus sp. VKM F-103]|nr:hypothetical protein V499_00853 [Pseudogymnoascus sp. VKM F-103]
MKLLYTLPAGACLVACAVASNAPKAYEPKYRLSPIDGSKIASPTAEQLAFQDKEIGVLIHYNIATDIGSDGCNYDPKLVPNQALFNPALINTDQWMESITALGEIPTLNKTTIPYNYTIEQSTAHGESVVESFVESAQKYRIGHGFYYSVVVNNFLNVQNAEVLNTSLAWGQVSISDSTYGQIVFDQLTELWTQYGNLTEIWLDGGYGSTQMNDIQSLLEAHQPQAIVFGACGKDSTCVSANPVRWIGKETGEAPEKTWSTGTTSDGGDPTSPIFCTAECDTTLQTDDRWFFGVDQPLRSIKEMIDVYHTSVGRNCVLELDLAPDRSGLIPARHAARYKQSGGFIRSCYDKPIAPRNTKPGDEAGSYSLTFDLPTAIDRIVHAKIVDAEEANGTVNVPWTLVSNGTSVGHKKIDFFDKAITVTDVLVNSTYVDIPKWRSVSVHLCGSLTYN